MSYRTGHAFLEVMLGDGGSLEHPQTQMVGSSTQTCFEWPVLKQLIRGFEVNQKFL